MKKLSVKSRRSEDTNIKDFKKTVHMLIELLGRDMGSTNPSRDRDMLIAARDGLFRVEVSGQLFEYIKSFRALLVRNFSECAHIEFNIERQLRVTQMAAKLAVQAFSGKAQIRDFLQEFGVDMVNTQMGIFAITQFIEVVRRLPTKFFAEPDMKIQTIAVLQKELDELIVREEEEENSIAEE